MNIQVNTDHNIAGSAELNSYIESSLTGVLERFKIAITRIEVHLSDENGSKTSSNDKRCLLEARIAHHQPIVVTHHADSVHEAVDAATHKLVRSLDKMVGKLTDHHSSHKDFSKEKLVEIVESDETIYASES